MCRPFHESYTAAPALPKCWPTTDKLVERAWVEAIIEHPFVRGAIGGTASSLCPRPRFGTEDREDMRQELTLALVRALPRFDAARQVHVFWFVQVVVVNAAKKQWRKRAAKKRQANFVPFQDVAIDLRRWADQDMDLRLDVRAATERLPRRGRRLVALLASGAPMAEVARRLRASRGDVERARDEVRQCFEACGMSHYVVAR